MKKLLVLVVFFIVVLIGCTREDEGASEEAFITENKTENTYAKRIDPDDRTYGDTLIEGSIGDANNLIPILANDISSHTIAGLIYDGLLKYDKELNIVGDLARSWQFSDDFKVITFNLRRDVFWHDGKHFNADDVIFTYKVITDQKTPTPYDGDFRKISRIKKIDDYTVEVYYNEPYAPALASWTMYILPEHLLKDADITKSYLQRNPIGTGPFKFKSWNSGSKITLVANDYYFNGRPHLNGYIFRIIPDPSSMFLELLNEKIDLMELTPIQYIKQTDNARFSEKFKKYTYLSDTYTFIGYNLQKDIFKDKRVRQALTYATPKKEIIDGVLFGLGKPATGPYKPGTIWYNENVKKYEFNLEKAAALLDKAGFILDKKTGIRKKDDLYLKFTVVTNQGNQNRSKVVEILQNSWKKIGVSIDIRILEWATFINEYINKRNFDAVLLAWTIGVDPDLYDVWHSSRCKEGGLNFTCYQNTQIDDMIEEARQTLDTEERKKIYFKIQEILAEEQPYTFLYISDALIALHNRFKEIIPAPAGIKHNIEKWYVLPSERLYNLIP
jgi:peptide/nickel transport system substrate-binding protein